MPDHFDARTRAALEYVSAMAHDAHDVTDGIFANLQEHFTETQILEITAVAAVSSYFNRLTAALRVDLSGSDLPYEEGPL